MILANLEEVVVPTELVSLKKADLHRHLLGSITPAAFSQICNTHQIPVLRSAPKVNKALVIARPVDGLQQFFKPWRLLSKLLISPSVVKSVVVSALEAAHSDNVVYTEIRAAWGMLGSERFLVHDFLSAVGDGLQVAATNFGVTGRLIFGITRHLFGRHTTRQRRLLWGAILSAALQFKDKVVVGFDLSGLEDGFSALLFREELQQAREAGFQLTVHCGETTGPEAIWEVCTKIRPDRIAHALSCVRDPQLLRFLAEGRIPIEVCPTVNWLTRTWEPTGFHPIRAMYDAGLRITVCTDNPAICNTTLSREFAILQSVLHFDASQLADVSEVAFESAFASEPRRKPAAAVASVHPEVVRSYA